MPQLAPPPQRQVVCRGDNDYDALHNGAYIGSFPSAMEAQVELDRRTYEEVQGEAAAETVDRSGPFAVGELPEPGVATSAAMVQAGYERFCALYRDSPKVLERAARALEIACKRDQVMTFVSTTQIDVHGSGSRPYRVQIESFGTTCTCKDFWPSRRQAIHGGSCKHIIAVELIRMAQAMQTPQQAPAAATQDPINTMAFVTVSGQPLGLVFGIARLSGQTVTIAIDERRLTIVAGDSAPTHTTSLHCSDGSGSAAIQFTPDSFGKLWAAFKPVATALDTLNLFVDPASSLVVLCGDVFCADASGTPVAATRIP